MSWVRVPPGAPLHYGVRPGHIGYRSFRTHRLHFWAKRVFKRLQSFFLQIDVAKIVIHKADQPNTFFDFLDTDSLTSEDRTEINFFAVETDTPAVGDVDGLVVEGVIQFGQAAIGTGGGSIDFRGALHVEGLVRSLIVELLEKIIEFALLLQTVQARRTSGFVFERKMHALMPTVLLRMTRLDTFDGNAQP